MHPHIVCAGTDSAYMGSPTGVETDSAYEVGSEEALPTSPTPSQQSTGCTFTGDLALATPPVKEAVVRPSSAGAACC